MKGFMNLCEFIKQKKLVICISVFIICGLNLFRLLHFTIGIDTEMALADYEANLNWIMGGGRFSGVLLRYLLMPIGFNYYLAILITILVLSVADIAFIYVLDKWGINDIKALVAFSVLFLTFPTFTEIFYFTGASYSIAIGILLSIVVTHLISEWVYYKKPVYFLCIGFVFGVFIIGLYQAFLFLIISEIVAMFILKVENDQQNDALKVLFVYAIKLIIIIILMGLVYYGVSKACINLFYKEEFAYAGHTKAQDYISGQIAWNTENIYQCFSNIKAYIKNSFAAGNNFGSVLTIILPISILIYLYVCILRRKNRRNIYLVILFIAFSVTPYLGVVLKGQGISEREQIILPFVIAFNAAYISNYVLNNHLVKKICFVFFLYIGFIKLLVSLELYQTDWLRYENDYAMAHEIVYSVKERYGSVVEKSLVFLGGKEWDVPQNIMTGDMIGASFFTWDRNTEWGINERVYYFMKSIGLLYRKPNQSEISIGDTLISEMDVWPKENSIRMMDNVVVIKLSN